MKLNGKEITIREGITLEEFLKDNGYDLTRIAVERNHEIVPKGAYKAVILSDADLLEVVSFVGGG